MGNKKREALVQFNKENIITAARKLFETKGILATTVEDIAREADYSKSTLYVYFESKDDILNHILLQQMSLLKNLLEKCTHGTEDVEVCYFSICQELVRFQETYPVYYEEMLGEIKITEKDIEEKSTNYDIYIVGEEINEIVEDFLKKGISDGVIRSDIEVLPTVLYLWSGISETIRFADQKQEYLKMRLGMEKRDYMDYGFKMLLKSIKRPI